MSVAGGPTPELPPAAGPELAPRSRAYLRLLLLLLVSAAFFDGYDAEVLALLLPQIQTTFHASTAELGVAHIPIVLGQLVAFVLVVQADRVGRRPVLLWSVIGYTVFTGLTALAPTLPIFVAFQFFAQIFIGAEYGIAVTVVVEEFPEDRRGRAMGTLLTVGPFGAIVVGALLAVGLQDGPLAWRSFYLVGLVPLVVVAVARRRLQETQAFTTRRRRQASDGETVAGAETQAGGWELLGAGTPVAGATLADGDSVAGSEAPAGDETARGAATPALLEPWSARWRGRLVAVGVISFLQLVASSAAVAWWAYYAERERGFSTSLVALFVIGAFGLGTLGYYSCGRLMERFGRKRTAIAYTVGSAGFGLALFQVSAVVPSFFLLIGAVFFGLGIAPALSAFATELFPTQIRAQANSWVRAFFGVAAQAAGPALVGVLGDRTTGAIGSIGGAVSVLLLATIPNLWLIRRYLPESQGVPLEVLSPTSPSPPEPRLARRFVVGVIAVAVVGGLFVAGVAVLGTGRNRPGGAAEAWVEAVGASTGSTGQHAAARTVRAFGTTQLAEALLPPPVADANRRGGTDAFTRAVVGPTTLQDGVATAPFLVAQRHGREITGTLRLVEVQGAWRVDAVTDVAAAGPDALAALAAPGAPWPTILARVGVAAVGVLLLALVCDLLVRWASQGERRLRLSRP